MKTNYYQKPQISVEDQIKLLKSEGLTFINEAKANHLLQNISLFRLKSYLKPSAHLGVPCWVVVAKFATTAFLSNSPSSKIFFICRENYFNSQQIFWNLKEIVLRY